MWYLARSIRPHVLDALLHLGSWSSNLSSQPVTSLALAGTADLSNSIRKHKSLSLATQPQQLFWTNSICLLSIRFNITLTSHRATKGQVSERSQMAHFSSSNRLTEWGTILWSPFLCIFSASSPFRTVISRQCQYLHCNIFQHPVALVNDLICRCSAKLLSNSVKISSNLFFKLIIRVSGIPWFLVACRRRNIYEKSDNVAHQQSTRRTRRFTANET